MGAVFMVLALRGYKNPDDRQAWALFRYYVICLSCCSPACSGWVASASGCAGNSGTTVMSDKDPKPEPKQAMRKRRTSGFWADIWPCHVVYLVTIFRMGI